MDYLESFPKVLSLKQRFVPADFLSFDLNCFGVNSPDQEKAAINLLTGGALATLWKPSFVSRSIRWWILSTKGILLQLFPMKSCHEKQMCLQSEVL